MTKRRTGTWAFWIIGNLVAYAILLQQARLSAVSLVVFVNACASVALDPRSADPLPSWRNALKGIAIITIICIGVFFFARTETFEQIARDLRILLLMAVLVTGTTAYRILWRRKARLTESRVVFGGKEFHSR